MKIRLERWPWQDHPYGFKYGWKCQAPMGRFGAGWNWRFGIDVSRNSAILYLIFGMITIRWKSK